MVAGVINGHVACKYIYVRLFRGTGQMHKRNLLSSGSWVLIALVLWIIAWVISEAIPNFNNLLSLMVSANGIKLMRQDDNLLLFRHHYSQVGLHVCFSLHHLYTTTAYNEISSIVSLCGIFWLSLNKGLWFCSPLKIFLTILNLVIIMIGICVVGITLFQTVSFTF